MLMPTSGALKVSAFVRCTDVRLNAKRIELTVSLLRTIVWPPVNDCARLSRPPSVVIRMFSDFMNGGSDAYVVAI